VVADIDGCHSVLLCKDQTFLLRSRRPMWKWLVLENEMIHTSLR